MRARKIFGGMFYCTNSPLQISKRNKKRWAAEKAQKEEEERRLALEERKRLKVVDVCF